MSRKRWVDVKGEAVSWDAEGFGSNLGSALVGEGIDLGAALGNQSIGDIAPKLNLAPGTAGTIPMHAMLGGVISMASGGDFKSGAIAGGAADGLTPIANQYLAQYVSEKFLAGDLSLAGSQYKITTAQIIGLISAGLAGGNPAAGSMIGGTGEKYNQQDHYNGHFEAPTNPDEALVDLKDEFDVFHPRSSHSNIGDVDLLDPVPGKSLPVVGGGGSAAKAESISSAAKPLGLGSTGRSTPNNLNEKLALVAVMSNPEAGRPIPVPMTDARWPGNQGWIKTVQNINGI